jgi:RND family efflux transporter MFP subunit
MPKLLYLAAMLAASVAPACAQSTFTVTLRPLADEKAVFATIESQNVVPARARIGGTIVDLRVDHGDQVTKGQTIALVADDKLQLQLRSLDAQIAGLSSQLSQAQVEFGRSDTLARTGATSRQKLDETRTAVDVAKSALGARIAERAVVAQQVSEGAVLAPTAGRVLQVPLTTGAVILPGEPVAQVAEANFVLRLSLPERHVGFVHAGDKVRLDGADLGTSGAVFGTVLLVYPQIQDGRVRADATAPGIGTYFVGQRIRVWVSAGNRMGFLIPGSLVRSRFGLSYVAKRGADGSTVEIPIQRGRDMPAPDMPDGVEILSGLQPGDVLVAP